MHSVVKSSAINGSHCFAPVLKKITTADFYLDRH